jgi:tRNA threonylcarbamoyladenosine biosynthesis protein TsaE
MAGDSYLVQRTLVGMAQTDRLAGGLARILERGDFIALAGALGTGKTTLARGLIQSLVPDEEVPSPTFTLVQAYDAPGFRVAHADLYRVKSEREVVELGFDEALEAGVLLVEWPDRMGRLMPSDRLDIILEVDDGGEERRVKLIGRGSWAQRLRVLARSGGLS